MKAAKVTMIVNLKDCKNIDEIKKWEHHIDYAIDLDQYPEIDSITDVHVEEISNG